MLIIRKEQMDVLSNYMKQSFENRIFKAIKIAYPELNLTMNEAELRLLIHNETAKAAEYGIIIEHDVERFINLAVKYGVDFDSSQSWATDFLYKKPLDYPSETVDFLVALSINQLAED